jgi:integrase
VRLLRWGDIDEGAGVVLVDKGRRQARLTDGLRAELAKIGRHPNSPYVLPRVFGGEDPAWRNDIEHLWEAARREAGALWMRLPRPRDLKGKAQPPTADAKPFDEEALRECR